MRSFQKPCLKAKKYDNQSPVWRMPASATHKILRMPSECHPAANNSVVSSRAFWARELCLGVHFLARPGARGALQGIRAGGHLNS